MWPFILRPHSPPASSPAPIRPSRLVAIKTRASEQAHIHYPSPGKWRGPRGNRHWSEPDPPLTDTGWRRRPRSNIAQAISSDSDDAVEEELLQLSRQPDPSDPLSPLSTLQPVQPSLSTPGSVANTSRRGRQPTSSPVVSDEWAYRSQANAGMQEGIREGGWNCSALLGTIVSELPPFLGCARPASGGRERASATSGGAPPGSRRRPVDD
jgi:hypothetical protein